MHWHGISRHFIITGAQCSLLGESNSFVVRYGGRNGSGIAERFMLGVIVGLVVIDILGVLIQGIFPAG